MQAYKWVRGVLMQEFFGIMAATLDLGNKYLQHKFVILRNGGDVDE
jgi:hypothetical protein